MSTAPESERTRIRIGVIGRTFGLDGGVRCALDAEAVPTIAVPCAAWLGYSASYTREITLERYEARSDEIICFFVGIGDRSAAESLLDQALFLAAESVRYADELINPRLVGFQIRDEQGTVLGVVTSIFRTPAHAVWQIESDAREWLLPAISQFVLAVLDDERAAIVRTIPGMMQDDDDGPATG